MTFEWAALSAVAAVAGFGLAFATFWLTFGKEIAAARGEATAAKAAAVNAALTAKEAVDKINIMAAAHSLFREQVAKEYINREVAREMEDRLVAAIDQLGRRFDRFMELFAETINRNKS